MSAATINPFDLLSMDADAEFSPMNTKAAAPAAASAAAAKGAKAAKPAKDTKLTKTAEKTAASAPASGNKKNTNAAAAQAAGVPPKPVTARVDTRLATRSAQQPRMHQNAPSAGGADNQRNAAPRTGAHPIPLIALFKSNNNSKNHSTPLKYISHYAYCYVSSL